MSNIDFITVQDHISDAKSRINFLCTMLNVANIDHLVFNDKSLHGLIQNLWDVDDVLDEANELIDQLK